ncbi:carbohydrate sulfotransferase 10-like [Argopecten irradians]|uniref:carbohydrate sulfotransferase 10-like n=1 Tax=Argopecten irradians TaxID=31199 RepID=UPI003721B0C2
MVSQRWIKKVLYILLGFCMFGFIVKWIKPIKTKATDAVYLRNVWAVSELSKEQRKAEELREVGQVNKERRERIQRVCSLKEKGLRMNKSRREISSHMYIDRKHKLTYCYLLKSGFTFWGTLFKIVAGVFNTTSPFDPDIFYKRATPVASLQALPQKERAPFFNNSFSFMFTRDPYTRLLSGYTDKLFMPNSHWQSVAPSIARVARRRHQTCVPDIEFKEFIKYIIHSEEHGEGRDAHYHFAFNFCDPCQYKYDFIGQMETIKQDTMYLLDKMNQSKVIQSLEKDLRRQYANFTITERVDMLFRSKGSSYSCKENFFKIQQKIWKGFQMNGIISTKSRYPISEEDSNRITPKEFRDAVIKAIGDAADGDVSRRNKEEAMLEAYSTVDTADMEKLSKLLQPDCEVFGYDCRPDKLFKDRKYIKPWYFDISTA